MKYLFICNVDECQHILCFLNRHTNGISKGDKHADYSTRDCSFRAFVSLLFCVAFLFEQCFSCRFWTQEVQRMFKYSESTQYDVLNLTRCLESLRFPENIKSRISTVPGTSLYLEARLIYYVLL